jgi:hypothetical protein
MVDVKNIKPGDTVTLKPGVVLFTYSNIVAVRMDNDHDEYQTVHVKRIETHTPKVRELEVGDKVSFKIGSGFYPPGTILNIQDIDGKKWAWVHWPKSFTKDHSSLELLETLERNLTNG